jgi:phosphatidylinositol 4-kinase
MVFESQVQNSANFPDFSSASRNIRRKALQKIAALSATSCSTAFDNSDLDRLCKGCSNSANAKAKSNGYGKGGSVSLAGSAMVQLGNPSGTSTELIRT